MAFAQKHALHHKLCVGAETVPHNQVGWIIPEKPKTQETAFTLDVKVAKPRCKMKSKTTEMPQCVFFAKIR